MLFQYPSGHVLIDFDAESIRNLLRDLETPKPRVPSLHLHDRGNDFFRRSFGPRLPAALRDIKESVLAPDQGFVKTTGMSKAER